jgi:cyclophilin family peptidyl-prolyl cis-trans isomerase/uncharacterized SAM-binding protein YcdF (DUF218 family)
VESEAIVVLGCAVRHAGGRLAGAAGRRAAEAARVFGERLAASGATPLVVASGGRAWGGVVEADALADELARRGIPATSIVRERCSMSTRDNAHYSDAALARRGIRRATIVTCAWHLPRAAALFRARGLEVVAIAAPSPAASWPVRVWRAARERIALRIALLAAVLACVALVACSKAAPPTAEAGAGAVARPVDWTGLARAEDARRAKDVLDEARASSDVSARRRAARALARIADGASVEGLLRALGDEDDVVVAWGAYGLGHACKGREEAHVRALAARAATLGPGDDAGAARLDARTAVARAIGRCGGAAAEQLLADWIKPRAGWAERALWGLGDLASRKRSLGDDTMTVLLDAASASSGAPIDAAFYPLARAEIRPQFVDRVVEAARGALARPKDERIYVVKALAKCGKAGAADLVTVLAGKGYAAAERAEAARGLASMGDDGRPFAADALARLTPDKDPFQIQLLGGAEFGVLLTLVDAMGAEPPKKAEPSLYALAGLAAPGSPPESLARRIAELRCAAAAALAKAAIDADVLKKCAPEASEAAQSARLTALLRRPLVTDRRAAWRALAKSDHLRVREKALQAFSAHPELGEVGRAALAEALASPKPGLVATATEVLVAHPDRAMALAESERRAALDPKAPPPGPNPAQELDPQIAKALTAAMDRAWKEDLVETRAGVLDAAVALRVARAKALALAACKDPNATMRERAAKALRTLGEAAATCPLPEAAGVTAAEIGKELTKPVKITFVTTAGEVSFALDPELAPVTATRIAALARSGFYKGVVVHRVVPGFVVQFGDPDGDGYGGAGTLLRCETSPVPFKPLAVGMALAGRDTGSSQVFVTLARTAHLDGEYTHIGSADGDWAALSEGDVIREVRVQE